MKPTLHRALHCIALTICAFSQGVFSQTTNLGHQAWTTENGLPQNSVHAIFQSRDGYLWIATEGGVARFNGHEFKIFQHENTPAIASDDICCFAQIDNSIWIGTADGLLRYDSGGFRRYTASDALPSKEITGLATDNSSLYVLADNGLARFDGKALSALPLPSPPIAIAPNVGNGILIASPMGLMQFRQGTLSRAGRQLAPANGTARNIGVLSDQTLWQLTRSEIAFTNGRVISANSLNASRVQAFLAGANGTMWVGTSKGLYYLDTATSSPQLQPDLGSNSILSLFEDAEGNLWVGTETGGLHVLRHRNFTTLAGFTDHIITSVTQTNDGAIWMGSNGDGLDRWLDGNTRHFSAHNGLLSDIILSLAAGQSDDLWVGSADGLNHIQGSHIESYTSADGLPDDFIRSLLVDRDNSLWIGTRRGLAHLQRNNIKVFTRADGLRSDLVGAMLQPAHSSDLWIGTLDGLSLLHDGMIKTFTTADGLPDNIITSLLEDPNGNLWIGTRANGLAARTTDGHFYGFSRTDLPLTVDALISDNTGAIWLGSGRGITRAPIAELISCTTSDACNLHLNHYGTADGMPTEEISVIGHPAALRTKEGTLWFATRKGVAIVDPAHLFIDRVPPPVSIERFTVDDVEQSNSGRISPGHTRFTFEYVGLSFVAPSQVRYRYKLEGFDKQWIEAGTRRTAFYTNLAPGAYLFHVLAANQDGLWNESGATLSFTIRPPFYRTVLFFLLASTSVTALIVLLYRLRVRRLRSQFSAVLAERTRVAREIHDTLAQSFVGVSVQLELATQLLAQQKIEAAREQLHRTSAYVREGISEARRSIWDLRATTGQNTLPTRLSRLAEQYSANGLTSKLNIGGTYRPVDPAIENELLRIAQEALTNITRHAQANTAKLDLRYDPQNLTLTIVDDGTGFSLAQTESLTANGHFGLQGMRERASQIGAHFTIASSPGQGTHLTVIVPLTSEKGVPLHG